MQTAGPPGQSTGPPGQSTGPPGQSAGPPGLWMNYWEYSPEVDLSISGHWQDMEI